MQAAAGPPTSGPREGASAIGGSVDAVRILLMEHELRGVGGPIGSRRAARIPATPSGRFRLPVPNFLASGARRGLAVLLALAGVALAAVAPAGAADAGGPLHVLVISSFHQNIPWQRSFERGLHREFDKAGQKAQLYMEYLDAGRLPDGVSDALWRRYLEAKYRKIEIDVLMTESGPAAGFANRLPGLFARAKRIYLQPFSARDETVDGGAGVTVVNAVDDFSAAIREMQRLVNPRNVYVVADTSTPARQRRLAGFRKALDELRPGFETHYLLDRTMEQLTGQVAGLPDRSAIFYLLIFRDGAGRQFVPYRALELLAERANAPIFTNWESLLGSGIVGGHLISGERLGQSAAKMALGRPAAGTGPVGYGYFYDARQLRRWHIDRDRLPPGAVVRFSAPSLLERYRWEVSALLTALLLLAILSASMFALNIRRKEAEQVARESAREYRVILDQLQDVFYRTDGEGRITMVSPSVKDLLGYAPDEVIGGSLAGYYVNPERRAEFLAALEARGGTIAGFEGELRHKDGHSVLVSTSAHYRRDDAGRVIGVEGVARDIGERRALEEQLRQALKMEAVGQLTGGVAHDFNNLLAVISGNAELLGNRLGEDRMLSAIQRAAMRGAQLTQRLLAFSRKQTLQPRAVDVGELVAGLAGLFGPTLGESVELVTSVVPGTAPVMADPAQLENALLNLAINARDAMPDGGVFEIRCENFRLEKDTTHLGELLTAGDYVRIGVRDSGLGMSDEVLRHALEPFYTTKDVGQGSGLGLSMVYGFARQSGGDVVMDSAPGRGTEVALYLPQAAPPVPGAAAERGAELRRGDGQLVLVLEDEPGVREFAVNVVESLGYRVVAAGDARQARARLDEAGGVDLVLSDIVLPGGVSGPQFVAEARARYPGLRVVFMSGYAREDMTQSGALDHNETVLRKPFSLGELAQAIDERLKG